MAASLQARFTKKEKKVVFYFPPSAALKTNIQTSAFATKHNCLSGAALIHFYPVLPPRAAPRLSEGLGSAVGSAWEVILFPPNTLASCGVLLLLGCHSHCACLTHIPAASFHATALRTEIHKDRAHLKFTGRWAWTGTWDVNPLKRCIYLHLHLNLHPLSHHKIPPLWPAGETPHILVG